MLIFLLLTWLLCDSAFQLYILSEVRLLNFLRLGWNYLKLPMRTHTLQSPLGSRNCPQAAAILSLRFLVTMHKGHRISTGSHRSPHFIMSRAFIQSLVFLCHRSADPETWRFMMTFSRFSQGKSCLNVFKMSDKLWLPSIVDLQHIVDLHWNC